MFVRLTTTIKNSLCDILFPRSERARRVEEEKETPLPASLHERTYEGLPITVLASYNDARVHDCICALKFERDRHALTLLASLLDDFLIEQMADSALFGERVLCVPIPLSSKRHRTRGVNQIEEVLKHTRAVYTGQVRMINALVRTRDTTMQSTLPRSERLKNVRGAFAVSKHVQTLRGATILLIDDVPTTGATLHEAASVLEKAGARVTALALAG
jgi:ComF family protein